MKSGTSTFIAVKTVPWYLPFGEDFANRSVLCTSMRIGGIRWEGSVSRRLAGSLVFMYG